jgi:protein-tyrosine kinase
MSRIHDALKKAAQERTSQGNSAGSPGVEELIEVAEVSTSEQARLGASLRRLEGPASVATRVDELAQKCAKSKWSIDPRMSVFEGPDERGIGAERFRTLRSRLCQIAGTRRLRRVLITSSMPGEGKTFIASNLAQSFVRQPDQRVLLIDADLRASRLHLPLGAPRNPGLTDYLSGEADEFQVIQKGSESNLFLVAGGREVSNPSELLMNERLKKFLDWVTPSFDWIILDSPPAMPVHDASLIADNCDGVLFVVLSGATDYEVAERAAAEFQEKNLIGVVLNRVEKDASYGSYYYGYSAKDEAR